MSNQVDDQIAWKRLQVVWIVLLSSVFLGSLCFVFWINLSASSSSFLRICLPSLIVFAYLLQLCSFLSSCVYRRGAGSTLLSHHRRLSNVCTFYFVFSSLFWVWFIGAVVGVSKYRAFLHPITGLDDSFSFFYVFYGLLQLWMFVFSFIGFLSARDHIGFGKTK